MSEEKDDLIERLKTAFDADHDHDCDGRTYVCSCDFDETVMIVIEDAASEIQRLRGEVERLSAENTDLKQSVIAFCAPWAVTYARDGGLPDGHLHPGHYDILEKCGARMVDFTRANLQGE